MMFFRLMLMCLVRLQAIDFLRSIEANAEMMGTSDYVETMIMRIKTLLADAKLKPVICPDEDVSLVIG